MSDDNNAGNTNKFDVLLYKKDNEGVSKDDRIRRSVKANSSSSNSDMKAADRNTSKVGTDSVSCIRQRLRVLAEKTMKPTTYRGEKEQNSVSIGQDCCMNPSSSNFNASRSVKESGNSAQAYASCQDQLYSADYVPSRNKSVAKCVEDKPRTFLFESCAGDYALSSKPSNRKSILVNSKSYAVIDLMGTGGSSKVYQVLDETSNKCLAIKIVDLKSVMNEMREAYLNEIKLLLDLRESGCVIKLYDYELRKGSLLMVMEKGDVDLATFMRTKRGQIDDIFIRYYWSEMLKCVAAIHEKGVIHSDLKPANFLLVEGNLKLIDFGIASRIPTECSSVMKGVAAGTLSYMPPEAIGGLDGNFTKVQKQSDVWSLGCILYSMVYGHTPHHTLGGLSRMYAILNQHIEFPKIHNKDLLDVLQRCLEKDPSQRYTIDELRQHPYLKKSIEKTDCSPNQSMVAKDDVYYLKIVEDLRQCTPRSSAKKLRDLMQK